VVELQGGDESVVDQEPASETPLIGHSELSSKSGPDVTSSSAGQEGEPVASRASDGGMETSVRFDVDQEPGHPSVMEASMEVQHSKMIDDTTTKTMILQMKQPTLHDLRTRPERVSSMQLELDTGRHAYASNPSFLVRALEVGAGEEASSVPDRSEHQGVELIERAGRDAARRVGWPHTLPVPLGTYESGDPRRGVTSHGITVRIAQHSIPGVTASPLSPPLPYSGEAAIEEEQPMELSKRFRTFSQSASVDYSRSMKKSVETTLEKWNPSAIAPMQDPIDSDQVSIPSDGTPTPRTPPAEAAAAFDPMLSFAVVTHDPVVGAAARAKKQSEQESIVQLTLVDERARARKEVQQRIRLADRVAAIAHSTPTYGAPSGAVGMGGSRADVMAAAARSRASEGGQLSRIRTRLAHARSVSQHYQRLVDERSTGLLAWDAVEGKRLRFSDWQLRRSMAILTTSAVEPNQELRLLHELEPPPSSYDPRTQVLRRSAVLQRTEMQPEPPTLDQVVDAEQAQQAMVQSHPRSVATMEWSNDPKTDLLSLSARARLTPRETPSAITEPGFLPSHSPSTKPSGFSGVSPSPAKKPVYNTPPKVLSPASLANKGMNDPRRWTRPSYSLIDTPASFDEFDVTYPPFSPRQRSRATEEEEQTTPSTEQGSMSSSLHQSRPVPQLSIGYTSGATPRSVVSRSAALIQIERDVRNAQTWGLPPPKPVVIEERAPRPQGSSVGHGTLSESPTPSSRSFFEGGSHFSAETPKQPRRSFKSLAPPIVEESSERLALDEDLSRTLGRGKHSASGSQHSERVDSETFGTPGRTRGGFDDDLASPINGWRVEIFILCSILPGGGEDDDSASVATPSFASLPRIHVGGSPRESAPREVVLLQAVPTGTLAVLQQEPTLFDQPPEVPPITVKLRLPPMSPIRRPNDLGDPSEVDSEGTADPIALSVWKASLLGIHIISAPYAVEHLASFRGGIVPTQVSGTNLHIGVNPANGQYQLYADIVTTANSRKGAVSSHQFNDQFHGIARAQIRRSTGLKHTNAAMANTGLQLRPHGRLGRGTALSDSRRKLSGQLSLQSSLMTKDVSAMLSRATALRGTSSTPAPVSTSELREQLAMHEGARFVVSNIRCRNGIVVHIIDRILFPGEDARLES
jgi:hypothetical protein